ncbi:MAG TPA: hypothetical protein VM344_05945 [Vitreimonas sp.]|nr:hypothetical protein [Vitreimonas sp.]
MTASGSARAQLRLPWFRLTIVVWLAIVIAVIGGPLPAAAHETPVPIAHSADLLRGEIVDVALLPPAPGAEAPLLLTVGRDPAASGATLLSVLDRGTGRWTTRTQSPDEPAVRGPRDARLVPLGTHDFALLVVSSEIRRSWVRTVRWTGQELRLGPRIAIDRRIDGAGPADVDGDGVAELVLVEAITRRGGPTCQGSTIVVIEPSSMELTAEHLVPDLRLGAGAVASLDDVPGDELIATASRNCPAGPSSAHRAALAAVRLRDGARLLDRSVSPADPLTVWSGRPRVVDLERDGRSEVLVGSSRGVLVVSPDRGWEIHDVPSLAGVLLGTVGPQGAGVGTVAVVVDSERIAAARLRRGDGGGWVGQLLHSADAASYDGDAWSNAATDRRNAALRLQGGPAWRDGDGPCSALVVPLAVVVPCTDPEHLRVRAAPMVLPGPAWFATRPLARFGGPRGPILVARVDRWSGARGRLTAPAPLAAEPPGAPWRMGGSVPFTLAEVDGRTFETEPPPGVAVGSAVEGDSRTTTISGVAGSRVVIAVAPARSDAQPVAPGLAGLLASAEPHLELSMHRLEEAELRLSLAGKGSAWEAAAAWDATVVEVGPLGDVSPPVRTRVTIDEGAPAVALEAPFLSLPWPFTTVLAGRTEAGVRLEQGSEQIPVGREGAFEVAAQLAPWPQRIELRAVDAAGNETRLMVEVVGGLDYRGLPWQAILVVGLVLAAIAAELRPRRPLPRRLLPAGDGVANEIEELSSGPIRPVR